MMMKFINILLAIVLTIAISPAITSAQENNPFEIPQGTEDNPLLDVKYNIEMEPYFFVGEYIRDLSFRTYICYTAIYADGTTKVGKNHISNFTAPLFIGGIQCPCRSKTINFGEEPDWIQDENVWSKNRTGTVKLYDLSKAYWDWDTRMFLNLKNLSQSKRLLTPYPYRNTCATDDVSFVERNDTEPGIWSTEYYDFYPDYTGYRLFVDKDSELLIEADFLLWHPTIKLHDEANTVVSCTPYEIGTWEMDIENLGSQYGYMESIRLHIIQELIYEGTIFHAEWDELVHFTYPTSEEMKQAAREAGYDVP